jgi:hypothetical protein
MSAGFNVLLSGCLVAIMCVMAVAAAKRPSGQWNYFHFDGRGFVAGQATDGTAFVAMRDGVRPVVLTHAATVEAVNLTKGAGAIAGICYIQSSGGKLTPGPAYLPCTRVPVQISSGGRVVATIETNEQGYFLATLPAGRYRISSKEQIEVLVENGITTLVPLRAGKRMVD